MRLAWADALEEWLPEYSGPPSLRVLFASGDRPAPGEQHLICLSSFEMAARLYDTLKATQYKFVIVDEAHKLRGPAIPRPAPYTASEAAAAATATQETATETTTLPHSVEGDSALAATSSPGVDPSSESVYFPNSPQPQKHCQQPQKRFSRQQRKCRLPDSGQEVNKKVLDLVKGSRHALLLSGTPSVKLPADLFPLVDALLPPLEQVTLAERRQQQLQQWRALELAAAAAAVPPGVAGAAPILEADLSGDGWTEAEQTKGVFSGSGIVRSPWSEGTTAWRTASAAARAAAKFAGAAPEAFGEPFGTGVCPDHQPRDKDCLGSFANGGQARQRVGNILREERLQFAGEAVRAYLPLLVLLFLMLTMPALCHGCCT